MVNRNGIIGCGLISSSGVGIQVLFDCVYDCKGMMNKCSNIDWECDTVIKWV